jgi:hypothetical protein
MYKTKDDKILCMSRHKDGFNIKAEWHSLTSHRKEPCDDTRGIINISKSRASHQHPIQDKVLTINSLYQWPQNNFQFNVPIQWLELSQNMLLSCTEKEKN